ncbi:MAG: hypothetical protein ABSB49_08030 [Polyangia bacterium]|jgi:hypothetical protein
MSQKSPLALVNETFGAKDKLVDKLVGLLDRGDESKDDLRKRLSSAANVKLLHLHTVATVVKEKYGSHEALVESVAKALGRSKDKPFVERLAAYSDARLIDLARASERREKKAVKVKAKKSGKATKAAKPTTK